MGAADGRSRRASLTNITDVRPYQAKDPMPLKIAAWNCCNRYKPAADHLIDNSVDVAILSEVGTESPAGFPQWEQVGDRPNKRLALASTSHTLTNFATSAGRWAIRALHESGLGILGIWSNPVSGSKQKQYVQEVQQAIDDSAEFLKQTPSVVAGDFNMFSHAKEFVPVVDQLRSLGYGSLHHHFSGDPLPRPEPTPESPATFYMHKHRDKPYHIDYMFVAESLLPKVTSFEIGSFDETVKGPRLPANVAISDHTPLLATLDI